MSDQTVSSKQDAERPQVTAQQTGPGSGESEPPLRERMRRNFYRRRNMREMRRRESREERARKRLERRDRRSSARARRNGNRRDSMFESLTRSRRRWMANRQQRLASKKRGSALSESLTARWRRWRGQRHAARTQRVPHSILPNSTKNRWRDWRWKRIKVQSQRQPRNILPTSWKKRWHSWTAGADRRLQSRRAFYSRFVPARVQAWWTRQSPPQRSRVRRAVLGSTLIVAITVFLLNYEPKKVTEGGKYIAMFSSDQEYSAYTNLARAPRLAVAEITPREQLLRRSKVGPLKPPDQNCGPKGFQSALSSAYRPNSIQSAVCAGYYGIARIQKTGTAPSASVGFFAVDSSGRWRLVSTVSNPDNLEETLPDGFPASLIDRWAKRTSS